MGPGDPGREALSQEAHLRRRVIARAWDLLDELRSYPELLVTAHWDELPELAGPASTCWTDVERFHDWTTRAAELLRAIASTPPAALSDSEWAALLGQAAAALEEAASAEAAALADGDLLRRIPRLDDLEASWRQQAADRETSLTETIRAGQLVRTPVGADPGPADQVRGAYSNPGGSLGDI
jgi:hypothetical protein